MIKERIIQIVEYKNIGKEYFFRKIGTTSANFRGNAGKTPVNSNILENIFTEFPDLNLEWLITGNGEMFKSDKQNSIASETIQEYSKPEENNCVIEELRKQNYQQLKDIEWYKKELDKKQEMLDVLLSGNVSIQKNVG